MTTNWLHVALAAALVYSSVLIYLAAKRRWTWAAMGVALANFLYVLLNLAAPFRGLLDPDYAGYQVGVLSIAPGPWVTVVSGAIIVGALTAAGLALLNRPGRGMIYIALFDSLLLLLIAFPELLSGLAAPADYRIELGEYLQIPGLLAVLLANGLLCLPLLYSVYWSARRLRPRLSGAAAVGLLSACLLSAHAGLVTAAPPADSLVYDDLDGFAAAIAEIDAGSEPVAALQRYLDGATPGMQIFRERFGTSAQSIAERLASHPTYYRYLAGLRGELEAQQSELLAAIGKLQAEAPAGSRPVPIYFLIANMRAGGNPGLVNTPQGPRPAIGVAIELLAMSERVDLTEFPQRPPPVALRDIPQVALHEMAHVFQMQAQGLDNYRSLYTEPGRMTHLALAVREGCADFLVWRAVGWRLQDRHDFVSRHAEQLWAEFGPLLQQPVDPAAGWFGPPNAQQPERPMQVGYGIGMQICEDYFDAADDKARALEAIYGAYLPDHFQAIVAPYAARMSR